MKKKTYQQPEMKVVELESVEILAGSQGYNEGSVKINGGSNIEMEEEDF